LKLFCISFVSVLFQFHFNCADSFTVTASAFAVALGYLLHETFEMAVDALDMLDELFRTQHCCPASTDIKKHTTPTSGGIYSNLRMTDH